MLRWRRISAICFIGTPAFSMRLAALCRRICTPVFGHPQRLYAANTACLAVVLDWEVIRRNVSDEYRSVHAWRTLVLQILNDRITRFGRQGKNVETSPL
ncbi:hypothetical protein ILFOPFJJ_06713 [Ensifer psoraleae]|nr:hypothetical protein [Sinorhizobium psoraleae]